jgi:hypothetical protein
MECRELIEVTTDVLTGEAGEETRRELFEHLQGCESCRAERRRLEEAWAWLGGDPDPIVTPDFRRRALARLEEAVTHNRLRRFRPRPRAARLVLQAAAVLAAAAGGYLAARAGRRPVTPVSPATAQAPFPDLAGNPRLSNVSYEPADAQGRIRVSFELTRPHALVARPEEPAMASLLAYLVARNSESAGEKSRAIQLVSEHYGAGEAAASPQIAAALVGTLRSDRNPGVRKKAADALSGFRLTPAIRSAFLEALKSDGNPAVRMVAVEALARAAREAPDARTIESLRERAVDPQENGFVRARAASALKAIDL